jgi:hypothetical protein
MNHSCRSIMIIQYMKIAGTENISIDRGLVPDHVSCTGGPPLSAKWYCQEGGRRQEALFPSETMLKQSGSVIKLNSTVILAKPGHQLTTGTLYLHRLNETMYKPYHYCSKLYMSRISLWLGNRKWAVHILFLDQYAPRIISGVKPQYWYPPARWNIPNTSSYRRGPSPLPPPCWSHSWVSIGVDVDGGLTPSEINSKAGRSWLR